MLSNVSSGFTERTINVLPPLKNTQRRILITKKKTYVFPGSFDCVLILKIGIADKT